MPGIYTVQMLSMKYGDNMHDIRRALMDAGVAIDLNDCVDVDAAEKADGKIKAFLDAHHKAHMAEKQAGAAHDADKAAWLAEHNAAVEKALADAGGWEALVAKGGKVAMPSAKEGE